MLRLARRSFAAVLLSGGVLLVAGCGSGDEDAGGYGDAVDGDAHEHADAPLEHAPGPHGGTVLELTSDHSLHGELVVDGDDAARGRFYVLGADMKTPVPARRVAIFFDDADSDAETNLVLDAVGEANAESAEWMFLRERLPNGGEGELKGRVEVDIDGKEYNAPFDTGHDAHAGHDHAGHDHGHAHDDDDHGHAHGDDDHHDDDHGDDAHAEGE